MTKPIILVSIYIYYKLLCVIQGVESSFDKVTLNCWPQLIYHSFGHTCLFAMLLLIVLAMFLFSISIMHPHTHTWLAHH